MFLILLSLYFLNYWFLIFYASLIFPEHSAVILLFIPFMKAARIQICTTFIMSYIAERLWKWDVRHFWNNPLNTNWSAPSSLFFPELPTHILGPILFSIRHFCTCLSVLWTSWKIDSYLFFRESYSWETILTKFRREFLEPPGEKYEKNWDKKRGTSYKSGIINISPCKITWWKQQGNTILVCREQIRQLWQF